MSSIKKEAERCLKCKKAQCSEHCPVSTPVPQVMELFLNGEIKKAGAILFNNNPISAITSLICPHEKNCSGHCVLGKKSAPVEFYRVEEYISRFYLETMEIPEIKKNGIKVAVAGAGPAGITMSILLLLDGYDVTLFEAEDDIGGVLRFGIPPFRLPKDLLDSLKNILLNLGVHFRPNTRIGTNIMIDDLFPDGYKALFVSTGTGRPRKLGLIGETLGHVHFAIDYLKSPYSFKLGRRVVIIGAGNVAIDVARTAIRTGHSYATIHNAQAIRITDDAVKYVYVKRTENEDGTLTFEEDYTRISDIPADSVIIAIGQGPGADIVTTGVKLTQRGLFDVNEWGETDTRGVLAAGDLVSGPKTVVEAVAFTKKVFQRMKEYLAEEEKS